ncbi:tyrosine-type recombinase/integrase [Clostridium bowmanii]|uniref:tyrosine-type recombinase/integrase n=1 Tax=Clostridium bowmanii TaxID=132925 RepID=UPI001C0DFC35|nr:tyrosine-type recombinase/integrase [Clostridium bowmanii]MBU3190308.1 tyrosine-type recombinase/integrase [Clostridium bowmanii]MCA1072480.1 tyrosine-type recombinase/integrase [Clostridium bowmanii]
MITLKSTIAEYKENLIYTEKSGETVKGYMKELNKFQRYQQARFNFPPYLNDIKLNNLEEYLKSQQINGLAASSRSISLNILRAFYKYCYKKELVDRNITLSIDTIKFKRKERTYLVDDEVNTLVDEIYVEIIAIAVNTMYNTGMRVSECTNLKLKEVDLEKGVIHVIAGKGNKDRDIPINDKLNEILTDYLKNKRPKVSSENFFATKKSGKLSSQYINSEINKAVKRLGWEKSVSCHSLRHSFASRLVLKNVNIVKIQKLLGHADVRVTSVYMHTNNNELRAAVNEI